MASHSKNKNRKTNQRKKKGSNKSTLYNSKSLEAILESVPDGFRSLFKDAYISTRKLCVKSPIGCAPEGLFELVDRLCQQKLELADVACRSGCAWCCQQDVLIAPFEFHAVRDAIVHADLSEKIREKLNDLSGHPNIWSEGREMPVSPCPLLEDNHCLIYAARPIACRTQFAPDSDACRRAYEAASSGVGDSNYQRSGAPAVIGIAARKAVHSGSQVFLREKLRAYFKQHNSDNFSE
ncbi:MAG: Fe-S-cluster containining protein [Candidatus Azotimanducaceae bacterium]|jgi:Fe-S-cluster containining protein